jgi:hypothetical protein
LGRAATAFALAAAATLLGAGPAAAHAFGPRYDLPLPLNLYLGAAGAAVALSFVIMAVAFRTPPEPSDQPGIDLLWFRPVRLLLHPVAVGGYRAVSLAFFAVILAAGFFGEQETSKNIAPTFVWIIWWVGMAYVAALAGNPWPVINPWSIVFAGVERLVGRSGGGPRTGRGRAYPSWLGAWPAVVLFGVFAWFELIAKTGTVPRTLATVIVVYSLLTWTAMAVYGRQAWIGNGEALSLAFGVFGRFAPIGAPEPASSDGGPRHWYLRPYASALVVDRPCHISMTAFVLVMLSTVTFDGFKETPLWGNLLRSIAIEPLFHTLIRTLHDHGFDYQAVLETVMLALFPLLFLLVYLGFCWLAKLAAGSRRPVTEIGGLFVFSLVPIAIAYHLAHYLSYLLIAGQYIIPLASDPFGFGWNLFGTADYVVDITIVGARFVWYTAVIAIVIGHVFAVGVAHFGALRVFESAKSALRSQYPFLVLMVAYTMVSLWILSQPIVGTPNLSRLPSPQGTITLAPFQFQEVCFQMTAQEELDYEFHSDRPITFNIHYHDGLTIHYPVKAIGVTADSGRYLPDGDRFYCAMWLNQSLVSTTLTYKVSGP